MVQEIFKKVLMEKISLIITYFNEEDAIKKTFSMIIKQSLLPDEVIFINSNSDDNTSKILDELILHIKTLILISKIFFQYKISFRFANLGVQLSNNSLIAFMDCGLIFNHDWLKSIYLLISKLDAVLGSCILYGSTLIEICVAQTYGYGKKELAYLVH